MNASKQQKILYYLTYTLLFCFALTIPMFHGKMARAEETTTETTIEANTVTTADTTPPTIELNSPFTDPPVFPTYINATGISGVVSDGTNPEIDLTVNAYKNNELVGTIKTGEDGKWSFSRGSFIDTLTEAEHTIEIEVVDSSNNKTIKSINFVLDKTRPKVSSIKLSVKKIIGEVDLLVLEDLTQVKLDTTFTIRFTDNKIIEPNNINEKITLLSNKGTIELERISATQNTEKNAIDAVYKPVNSSLLTASTTYYLLINPVIINKSTGTNSTDLAGNIVYPMLNKFTTIRNDVSNQTASNPMVGMGNPHGNYTSNEDTCVNCHSTHVSSNKKLEQPKIDYSNDFNYCMACHDGTVAPLPESMNENNKHFKENSEHTSTVGACTGCHNPHLTWEHDNPNLLVDHFDASEVNEHTVEGVNATESDSNNVLCETCHGIETKRLKDLAFSENDTLGVKYKVFHYRKYTSTGTTEDYDLCLRCHDGSKEGVSDIKTFYTDSKSQHRITAVDGSSLITSGESANDGHIACAECHDTHGSANIKLLKNKLGTEDQQSFTATTGEWDAATERDFCIKCHNGSTAINGVTGKELNEATSGHEATNPRACSSCHGTGSIDLEKARDAAHAPKKGIQPTP